MQSLNAIVMSTASDDTTMQDNNNNSAGFDTEMSDTTRNVRFGDESSEVGSNDSITTAAASDAPSRVFSDGAESVSSLLSQGAVPPVPVSSPVFFNFSQPVSGIDASLQLLITGQLDLGVPAQPPNSEASVSIFGGSTMLPSPTGSDHDDVRPTANNVATIRGILRPSRSSHSSPAERAVAGILGQAGMVTALGMDRAPAGPVGLPGVREHSFWLENIREDLLLFLKRLRQAAKDMEDRDDSKTKEEYFDEELQKILDQDSAEHDAEINAAASSK